MRRRIRPYLMAWAVWLVIHALPTCQAQQDRLDYRRRTLDFLSNSLLGQPGPVKLSEGGWRAIVLSSPATPLSPAITAFDPNGYDTSSVSQLYENMVLFDRTLSVANGLAFTNEQSIPEVWDDFLNRTIPPEISKEDRQKIEASAKTLFRVPDDVDQVRGVTYLTEPSNQFAKYREYELLYRLIQRSKLDQDGAWRLHGRLSQFTTLEEAEDCIINDWQLFGCKQLIDSALNDYKRLTNGDQWAVWTRARKRFDANKITLDTNRWVARTFLYPPPATWLGLSSWVHMRQQVGGSDLTVEFDLLRVKIVRPWVSLGDLLTRQFTLNKINPTNANYTLTTGVEPTFEKFPEGRLAVFPEELLLVRNVRWSKVDGAVQEHPLGIYKYPEAINLAAYIVRVLPKDLVPMPTQDKPKGGQP